MRRRRRLTRRKYYNYGPNYCWHVDGKFCFRKTAGGGCHSFLYDISACQNSEMLFLLLKQKTLSDVQTGCFIFYPWKI